MARVHRAEMKRRSSHELSGLGTSQKSSVKPFTVIEIPGAGR